VSAGRHAQYCIDPGRLAIAAAEANAGTCGMRIMTVREACEAVGPNRKQHNETPATCARTRVFGLAVAASRQ